MIAYGRKRVEEPRTFAMTEESYALLRRRMILLLCIPIIIGVGLALWSITRSNAPEDGIVLATTIPMILIVVGAIAWFGIGRILRQQRETWFSIRYVLGPDYIAWQQNRAPDLRIQRDEITAVHETQIGLSIMTADKHRALNIPHHLTNDGYQAICTVVAIWSPIKAPEVTAQAVQRTRLQTILLSLASLAGVGLTMFGWTICADVDRLGYSRKRGSIHILGFAANAGY